VQPQNGPVGAQYRPKSSHTAHDASSTTQEAHREDSAASVQEKTAELTSGVASMAVSSRNCKEIAARRDCDASGSDGARWKMTRDGNTCGAHGAELGGTAFEGTYYFGGAAHNQLRPADDVQRTYKRPERPRRSTSCARAAVSG
jgi:hypothetical protein